MRAVFHRDGYINNSKLYHGKIDVSGSGVELAGEP